MGNTNLPYTGCSRSCY